MNVVRGIRTRVEESHAVFLGCAGIGTVSELMRFRLDGALREYSNEIKGLEDVLKQPGHFSEVTGLERVKDDRAEYKELVTETPYPNLLPQGRIAEESKLYSRIRSNLVSLELELADLD